MTRKFQVTHLDGSKATLEADNLWHAQNNPYLSPTDIVTELKLNPIARFLMVKSNAQFVAVVGCLTIAITTVNYPLWDCILGSFLWTLMIYSWSLLLRTRYGEG